MLAKVQVCALLFAATFVASAALSQPQSQNSADQRALESLDNAYRSVVAADADPTAADKSLKLIHRVIDRIARSFIEPFSVRELANYSSSAIRRYPAGTQAKDLADAAIHEMVVRLGDPYATFDERRMRRKGKRISGIGIEATILDGRLKVIAPLEGSPAQKAGVEPGDIIVEIDREEIDGLTLKEAMDRIDGPIGTEVLLRIQRKGARKLGLPIPRARFRVREIRHAMFGDIGYIRVAFFGPDTEKLLRQALSAIQKEMGGAKPSGYIIDIRNNPGGLVGQAILLADAFL
ncbi:MAG: PDZ domain-containing protein, partial [Pseudomonadota bacterium]|nr:PDZ domain-containing protein [Pseudomonadota bacterium]